MQDRATSQVTVICPLHIDLPRKKGPAKRVHLSQNVIRNAHFQIQNAVKHAVKEIVWRQLSDNFTGIRLSEPVELEIKLYKDKSRRADLSNFCSIIDKYATDALVEYGLISDDNVKVLKKVTYLFGGFDDVNPRAELTLRELP